VIVVGHSGAGLLLPTVADALDAEIAGLIFVDTFLPPASGSVPLAPPGHLDQLRALAAGDVLPPWSTWFGPNTMRELIPDPRLRTALEAEMPRLPLSYFDADVPLPKGWEARPSAYLLFSPEPYGETAAEARRRGWPVAEIPDVQHLAIATDPSAVADALLGLERALLDRLKAPEP